LLREHRVDHGFGAIVDAFQIDLDHAVELVLGHVLQLGVHDDTCVVDQDVDTAPLRNRGIDHLLQGLNVAHVGDAAECITARLLAQFDGFLDRFRRQIAHDDLRAFTRELDGGGLPDASSGPGDDCNFVL
jgi:hypothetical protein